MPDPQKPTKSGIQPMPPQPQLASSEIALAGPEYMPVYANFIRDFADVDPPPWGGNWVYKP